jgi:hypothetical protein
MFHIAQINIAQMRGVNIEDPVMKEFKDNLDAVNQAAESSKGFVWRLKDDNNNATSLMTTSRFSSMSPFGKALRTWSISCTKPFTRIFYGGAKNGFIVSEKLIPPCGGCLPGICQPCRKRWICSLICKNRGQVKKCSTSKPSFLHRLNHECHG